MVAPACNPICLGGRDQENHGLKSALAKIPEIPFFWWYLGLNSGTLPLVLLRSHLNQHARRSGVAVVPAMQRT
jgi:hypothetical protein